MFYTSMFQFNFFTTYFTITYRCISVLPMCLTFKILNIRLKCFNGLYSQSDIGI